MLGILKLRHRYISLLSDSKFEKTRRTPVFGEPDLSDDEQQKKGKIFLGIITIILIFKQLSFGAYMDGDEKRAAWIDST